MSAADPTAVVQAQLRSAFNLSLAICAATYIAMVLLIVRSPPHPIYDEGWFLRTLDILRRDGLSIAFIRDLPGAPGPTFTLVYGAIQGLFAIPLPWLRLVNLSLMTASVVMIFGLLRSADIRLDGLPPRQSAMLAAAAFVTMPSVAVSSGMTLTEVPAMFFALLFVCLVMTDTEDRKFAIVRSMLGGLSLGMAILGRQNYLVLLPALALLWDWPPSSSRLLTTFLAGAFAAILFVPVFIVWGGLVPPASAEVKAHVLPFHTVLSLGYFGVIALLIAPDLYRSLTRNRYDLWLVAGLTLAAVALAGEPLTPMHSLAARLGAEALLPLRWPASAAIAAIAFAFLLSLLRHAYEHWNDRLIRFGTAAVLLGALSNIQIYQFSSRYIFVFLPFLLLAIAARIRLSWHLPLRLALGSLIGTLSLMTYFHAN
jgi:4-amino-4-deoxy-L-arabinose transferase-like glycosyltransferase